MVNRIWGVGSHWGQGRWQGASTRSTGKIMCHKILLKRGKRRAIANLEREFLLYWRCCITESSTASDCGNCRLCFILRPETVTRSIRSERWFLTIVLLVYLIAVLNSGLLLAMISHHSSFDGFVVCRSLCCHCASGFLIMISLTSSCTLRYAALCTCRVLWLWLNSRAVSVLGPDFQNFLRRS